ncbi:acetylxylan esterase [Acidothermaceae bacterium B102]|nr:acetylxylan esterase [Acidothermaceae bacterium B102]
MFFDLPLDQLREVRPQGVEPADFDAFWARTLTEARAAATAPQVTPYDAGLATVDVFDVRFAGFNGEPIAAWLTVPRGVTPETTVVQYHGYSGSRGLPFDNLLWSSAGYAHLSMDSRGQGWALDAMGSTPDRALDTPGPVGYLTRGLSSPEDFYYRRLFTDAVLAVDFVRGYEPLRATKIAVQGGSQGGGIAIAVAGLVEGLAGAMPDVPFLCDYRRAVAVTDAYPYREIADYCQAYRDQVGHVFETLAYFDGTSFAARATAPSLFSVALMDQVCPPSTVFAAYNVYGGIKDIGVYEFNGHEGGGPYHRRRQLAFLRDL